MKWFCCFLQIETIQLAQSEFILEKFENWIIHIQYSVNYIIHRYFGIVEYNRSAANTMEMFIKLRHIEIETESTENNAAAKRICSAQ